MKNFVMTKPYNASERSLTQYLVEDLEYIGYTVKDEFINFNWLYPLHLKRDYSKQHGKTKMLYWYSLDKNCKNY